MRVQAHTFQSIIAGGTGLSNDMCKASIVAEKGGSQLQKVSKGDHAAAST